MNSNQKIAIQVSVVTIIVNIILAVLKFIEGIVGHSAAMISDAFHSLSDVLSTLSLIEAHNIAEKVHKNIELNFLAVKHCVVHVNPHSNLISA